MSNEYIIKPYIGASIKKKEVQFGMSKDQIKKAAFIYTSHYNATINDEMLALTGYNICLHDNLLQEIVFRFSMKDGKPYNIISVDGNDVSCFDSVEKLKTRYSSFLSRDRQRTLFPELGILVATEPFMELLTPRKGVFWNNVIAFSKERLLKQRTALQILTLHPFAGVSFAGSELIQFGMTPQEITHMFGAAEHLFEDYAIMKEIVEIRYGQGVELRYKNRITKYSHDEYNSEMPLSDICINEKHNWEVEIEGIRLFEDDKLSQMKSKYEYIDSPKGKATIFPTLGLTVCGCGEKKDKVNGKYASVFAQADVDSKTSGLYIYD